MAFKLQDKISYNVNHTREELSSNLPLVSDSQSLEADCLQADIYLNVYANLRQLCNYPHY